MFWTVKRIKDMVKEKTFSANDMENSLAFFVCHGDKLSYAEFQIFKQALNDAATYLQVPPGGLVDKFNQFIIEKNKE